MFELCSSTFQIHHTSYIQKRGDLHMKLSLEINISNSSLSINHISYGQLNNPSTDVLCHAAADYLRTSIGSLHGTYNRRVYWPQELQLLIDLTLAKKYLVQPTDHLRMRLKENCLPAEVYKTALYGEIVEAEVDHGILKKIITRLRNKHRKSEDICMATIFTENSSGSIVARVKTAWINQHKDNHDTLHIEKYVSEKRPA